MQRTGGTWNGTGAAVYLCLGFVPSAIRLFSIEGSNHGEAYWDVELGSAGDAYEGLYWVTGTTYRQIAVKTLGQGIAPYIGGDLLTSSNQTSVTYAEGVYLGWDHEDYSKNLTYGAASVLDTWTFDGTASGHVNAVTLASGTTRIGEGSKILIEETATRMRKWASVVSWAAAAGTTASDVTLSQAVATGKILKITGMYRLAPIALGKVTPAGLVCNYTTEINVNDAINHFIADVW